MTDPFVEAMTDLFNTDQGADALYTPVSGAPIPCRVLLDKNVLMQPASLTAQVCDRGTTIEAQLVEILTEPGRGAIFVVNPGTDNEETFTVQSIDQNDGITMKAIVT
jgi:hypothetical protein